MMAELDIKGAGGVETLMASAGVGETILPVSGTMSPHLFDVKADPKLKLKGVSLSMALPKVSIPGLPSSIKITKPVFNISDIVPPSISKLDLPSLPEVGPYTTIGLDLAMKALGKTHQFDALMLIGKDISNKMVVDLVGRAVNPNGFFDFKGLQATTLDLASFYVDKSWDFRLKGDARLNKASVGYFVEVKQSEGKVDYIATLDGGQQGLSLIHI